MRFTWIFVSILFLVSSNCALAQTMTFDNGAEHSGFTFEGWNSAAGTIWVADLATTATISKDVGTWDFVSFHVGPVVGGNQMRVESNLGDVYDYGDNILQSHNVNWTGITTLTFSRISGSGLAGDLDDIVYQPSLSVNVDEEDEKSQLSVFPNPFEDKLELRGAEDVERVVIFDALGKPVLKTKDLASESFAHFASGIYILHAYSSEQVKVLRLIKE